MKSKTVRKVKYLGWFVTTNHATYNHDGYEFTSLADARKTMKTIAKGNDLGSGAMWCVNDMTGKTVASGRVG